MTDVTNEDVGWSRGGPLAPPPARYSLTLIEVTSFLIVTRRGTRSLSGSIDELTAFSKKVLAHNLLLGWWGFPLGLIGTPMALYSNSKALRSLREIGASGDAAPGWYPDPAGRHGARYWDGKAWTERVSDTGTDPPS